MVSESSISANFSSISSGAVTCTPVLSTSSSIECKNIASITTATNYTISFAFVAVNTRTATDFASFGKYYFKMQGSNNQITTTSSSLDISSKSKQQFILLCFKEIFVNSEYGDSNWHYYNAFDTTYDQTITLT